MNELTARIEAVLFAHADPISIDKLVDIFELPLNDITDALEKFEKKLLSKDSGIKLIHIENKYQLCTKEQYAQDIKKAISLKRNTPLSQAALEILAIVAYNQPVTKAFVEQIRGVDCSWVISTLVSKDLIEENGRLNLPGRPITYGTTDNFLRCFRISSLDKLPDISEKSNSEYKDDEQTRLPLQA